MTKEEIKELMFTKVYGFNVVDKVKHKGELVAYHECLSFKFGLKLDSGETYSFAKIERIPEKKFRPFARDEIKALWPFTCVNKTTGNLFTATFASEEKIEFGKTMTCGYDVLLENYELLDGSPCGVEEYRK